MGRSTTNVIEMSGYRVQPRKVTQPMLWVKTLFCKLKQMQEKKEKDKIDALLDATYDFYLDLYLTGVEMNKLVDIHPALYKQGYTTCSLAYQIAMEQLIIVIQEKRVDECYKNLQKHIREMQKAKRGARSGKIIRK